MNSYAKGRRWATEVVGFLNANGFDAHRLTSPGPLADPGDIFGVPMLTIEAKNERQYDLAGYVNQTEVERVSNGTPFFVVAIHRVGRGDPAQGYALTSMANYFDLYRRWLDSTVRANGRTLRVVREDRS